MPALAGALGRSGPPDPATVSRMLAAAPHRGDAAEVRAHGRCVLGVVNRAGRREGWLGAGGDVAAAFAGVLDNEADVRQALGPHAPAPEATPADLVAALFGRFGVAAPTYLRGLFAVCVTDGERLWCFRDHLGFRTLFYRDDATGTFAASEAKQVVAGAGIRREPDRDVVEDILFSRYDDETPCAVKGVRRLPKATLLVVEGGRLSTRRYWNPADLLEGARLTPDEVAERFDQLMVQAAERAVTGQDVVSLSGGVDSPAVAAYAAPVHLERSGRPLSALSSVYPDHPEVDEREYIELVASHLGLPLFTFVPDTSHLARVREWVELLDGPTPTWLVNEVEEHYRKAHELGFRTILTGEVAEYVIAMRRDVVPHLLVHGRLGPLARMLATHRREGRSYASMARELGRTVAPRPVLAAYLRRRSHDRPIPDFVRPGTIDHALDERLLPRRQLWRDQQLVAFSGPGLTIEADEIREEVCDVRVRRPWADVDLWEFFLGLPAETKFPDQRPKGLVRELLRGKVPDAILDRRKNTVFNDAIMSGVDYGDLRHWLLDHDCRVDGIDYHRLAERLRREDLGLMDYLWAKDLAASHAFLTTG